MHSIQSPIPFATRVSTFMPLFHHLEGFCLLVLGGCFRCRAFAIIVANNCIVNIPMRSNCDFNDRSDVSAQYLVASPIRLITFALLSAFNIDKIRKVLG